ncbi:hypothetical protein NX784_10375 [Massilia pinisoli]|uniref:Uncharacterized protein n=1 Tax=Massilia pinisoli TaxID=1772194 RepID=A0ABT1ZPY8_9BURK|nr:hypothetical protein [Massilia pinisoli]MCS0581998.1 hypothetical protein [Massilia pinisoli]
MSAILVACGGGGGGGNTASTPVVSAYSIPAGVWAAPAAAVPASGNYLYLQSDVGDTAGGGRTYLYTNADSVMTLSNGALTLHVDTKGINNWTGDVLLPKAAGMLQAGYFNGLTRTSGADPAVGGVEWTTLGGVCNTIGGWVVIDKITLTAGVMTALDMRFEQRCNGSGPALHGQMHWTQADASNVPTGPSTIPATSWKAPASVVPSTGNYVYMENRWGKYLYVPSNAVLTTQQSGAHLTVDVAGDQLWTGNFAGMLGLSQLAVGYYPGLHRYPFHDPLFGGLDWSGPSGDNCNRSDDWFIVDKVAYSGTTLTSIDLRFEQLCEGSTVPTRGQLHWDASSQPVATGPLGVPTGLWAPAATFVPPAGNYVYLVSDAGDFIGAGATQLLTSDSAPFNVYTATIGPGVQMYVGDWSGRFGAPTSLTQLQPGYYGGVVRYSADNPIKASMDWSGNARGCDTVTGWFVVDKVTYTMNDVTALDLRFEQHCDAATPALRGVIHWVKP